MSFSNYKSITFRAASGSSLIDGGESGRYATNLIETTVNGQKDLYLKCIDAPSLALAQKIMLLM